METHELIEKYDAIEFMGGEIDCLTINEEPHAVMNSMIENIGLNYRSVHKSLKNDEILTSVCTERYTLIPRYNGKKCVCMPFQYIPGWLFSIDSRKVKEPARSILTIYKKDCYRVLHDYYFGRTKQVFSSIQRQHQIDIRLKEINFQITNLMVEHKHLEKERKQLVMHSYMQLGLDFPEFKENEGFRQKSISF